MAAVRTDAPFIGRTAELERLRQLTDDAAAGNAAAVLLSGDAGVGKTSLITEASLRATAGGMLVLLGRCVDLGTGALPYLPFAEALTQLVRAGESGEPDETPTGTAVDSARRAAQIVRRTVADRPGLAQIAGRSPQQPTERAPGDSGLDRLALFEAVAEVLGRIGDEVCPVLLVIEDLHWADASTRDLVRFLLARLGGDRLFVVVSYRADDLHRRHPLRPLLGELLRLPRVERMELLPFEDDELQDFLRGLTGDQLPDGLLLRISARSAGNAYYAEELLAAGAQDRLPEGLSDVLLDRLEQLSGAGQQVLRMASVLGSARIQDTLLRAAVTVFLGTDSSANPRADAEVDQALRETIAHQLLIPDGPDRYAFRHALLQEAVYTDLLPGERVRMHAAVAQVLNLPTSDLDGADLVAGELARHSLAAHDLPVALMASLRAASAAACSSAPAEALEHYEQALQLWDVVDPRRRPADRTVLEIAVAAAAAAGDAGLHERARQLAGSALGQVRAGPNPQASEVAQARAAFALHTYGTDRPIEARDQARQVIAELKDGTPSAARVLARSIEARVDLSLSEAEAALEVIPPALAEAEKLGLLGLRVDLLTTQAVAHGMAGRPDVAKPWAIARSAAEQAGEPAAMIRVLYNIAIDRSDRGDLPGAVTVIEEALPVVDASGLASSLYGAQSRSLLITFRWQLGDVDGALAVLGPPSGQPTGMSSGRLPAALIRQLRLFELPIHAVRNPGDVLSAGQWPLPAEAFWERHLMHAGLAEALYWLGRWAESVDQARTALRLVDRSYEPYPLAGIAVSTTAVAALADAAAHARERGESQAAQHAVEEAAPFVEDGRLRGRLGRPRRATMGPEGLAWLRRLEAEAGRLEGGGSAADERSDWAQVAQAFDGVSVFEVARARWRQAVLLVRAGERDLARAQAVAARRAAVRLGAAPLVAALDDLGRRARFELTKGSDGDVLTPREREVMALVAQGMTNRAIGEHLFISEKTASVHVSNVLAKLGASGRTEAVAIIARRGLLR